MAAAAGDLIRITDFQTLLSQQVLNVYFYRVNDITPLGGDYLSVIADWFVDNVLAPVLVVQLEGLVHTHLYLENISNGVDILTFDTDFPLEGENAGTDLMPPYVSLGFQLIRESRVTRNGYKRFAGVGENYVTNGVCTLPDDQIEDIEDALAADIHIGLVTIGAPVIVKRPFEVPVTTYEYSDIGSALFKGVGTQNTRKFGRGV